MQGPKSLRKLEFSEKYDQGHSRQYFEKHQAGFWRRLSNWRETGMVRKALRMAGNPGSILDLPCGTGRFWELLCEQPGRTLVAADYSQGMLDTARTCRAPELLRRFSLVRASAFGIPLADDAVECVSSIRFLHHVGLHEDRMRVLREFARVASDTVCLTLWVDGNYKARRRARLEATRGPQKYQNRFVVGRRQIEAEFAEAGLDVVGKVDFMPRYSMWRCYVLRKRR